METKYSVTSKGTGKDSMGESQTAEVTESDEITVVDTAGGRLDRYKDLGLLGAGGMGEVRSVYDRQLGRNLAMKIAHANLLKSPRVLARFVEEAQVQAQLQHPGIVSVHELGETSEGLPYFTMTEVKGRNLSEVMSSWAALERSVRTRKSVDLFQKVCDAVGFAHSRGVIHRDLKPQNVMVGDSGEVLVVDWGLAKVLGRSDYYAESDQLDLVETDRSRAGDKLTTVGAVTGTKAYMSPEQLLGDLDKIDARSDVYSLGLMLFEILCGHPLDSPKGEAPEPNGLTTMEIPWPQPESGCESGAGLAEKGLPVDLVAACSTAISLDACDRQSSAAELSEQISSWLDGERRRDRALDLVERAKNKGPERQDLLSSAQTLRAEASELLSSIESWRSSIDKAEGWSLEDRAIELERQAAVVDLQIDELLHSALTHCHDLIEAHEVLAHRYRLQHESVALERQERGRIEALLRRHALMLPDDNSARVDHLSYLLGHGSVTLFTDPPEANVTLYRYEVQERRLEESLIREFGSRAIQSESLPMGSYMCRVDHPDREEVKYPILISRKTGWDGVAPGGLESQPVYLPKRGELSAGDVYVPAGWFTAGGDPEVESSTSRRRVWVNSFVAKKFQVTNSQYIEFLDDLVQQGREAEALLCAPRLRGSTIDTQGAQIYHYESGRFSLQRDSDGDMWEPDWPVVMVDWFGANAYAAWLSEKEGLTWRLPHHLEWEKAARGVDCRFYPWGDFFDPSWANMADSHEGRIVLSVVDSYAVDCSVYGVRGMAGNVCDWTSTVLGSVLPEDGEPLTAEHLVSPEVTRGQKVSFAVKGGVFNGRSKLCRVTDIGTGQGNRRQYFVSFRLFRLL